MTPSHIQFVASLPMWHSLALALTGSQIDAKYQIIPIFRPNQFRPIKFLNLDLDRVYHFDLKIDDAIVIAVVANPSIAIFRPNRCQYQFLAIFTF